MQILELNNTMQKCIDLCSKCVQACEECLTACYGEADLKARVKCVQTLRDCADICTLTMQYMSRNSTYSMALCGLCAQVCDDCAKECNMFKDPHCKECAEICQKCAAECRQMTR